MSSLNQSYSKWDALELSDDSDIEVHPNVDKRSFIRAKQEQIRHERAQRKHRIETLKYERIVNDGLITRIDALLKTLKGHLENSNGSEDVDRIILQSIFESAGNQADDKPPSPPPGIHDSVREQPTYSQMMASLVDQVKKVVEQKKPNNKLEGYVAEVGVHKDRVLGLQQDLLKDLAGLEKIQNSKITSESIHFGVDSSHVNKSKSTPSNNPPSTTAELLNPHTRQVPETPDSVDSGFEGDIEDGETESETRIRPSALGEQFAQINSKDYQKSLQFISQNPSVLAEKETDGLLIKAFHEQEAGKSEFAKQCVHQALLLQYCRALGRDGVAMFFKRITTRGHQARQVFNDDVNATYARLKDRAEELSKQKGDDEEVEQIQLHAVNPGEEIKITIPPPLSEDKSSLTSEQEQAREIFDSFPPGLQRALESGSLDDVNKVLGKMSVSEAEEVVEKLSIGGMLSVEQGIIDATTEEGRAAMEEIERSHQMPASVEEAAMGEPGPETQSK